MEIVTKHSPDKAEVTIQGTIGDNARYFLLSDGQGKTAKTQIARDSESKLFGELRFAASINTIMRHTLQRFIYMRATYS